ncbi:MAG: T9SS type A sorting domain-containing protein [Taibaiella sp.]|nr:T9SS type A sorting domain-containing protein [Taibaiella sp.]
MLEKVIKNWDASFSVFVNKSKEIRSYNKNNVTKEIISYSWDGSNWIHADNDIIVRYYYEQYFPTNVSNLAADNAEMTVYPVPASENLHVSFNITSGQDFSIVIADMAGKAVYMDKVTGATAYSKTIPVDNIPSGTYLLRVHGTNGMNLTRKLSVVH